MSHYIILHKATTASTMDDAREALKNGAGHGTICRADHQITGRGRIPSRRWLDNGLDSLLFTVIVKRDLYNCTYPPTQAAALALCRCLETFYSLSPQIKWPNDVLVAERKLAGILVEVEGPFYLVGMGINISQTDFPAGLAYKATSLIMALSEHGIKRRPESPESEMTAIVDEFMDIAASSPPIGHIEQRLALWGECVSVLIGDPGRGKTVTGALEGLSDDGSLVLRLSDGKREVVYSGEALQSVTSRIF